MVAGTLPIPFTVRHLLTAPEHWLIVLAADHPPIPGEGLHSGTRHAVQHSYPLS
jgi:hypothetical protein